MNVGRLEVAARHLGSRFEDVVKPSTSKRDFDADGDCKDFRTKSHRAHASTVDHNAPKFIASSDQPCFSRQKKGRADWPALWYGRFPLQDQCRIIETLRRTPR